MQNLVLLIIKHFSYSDLVKHDICFNDRGFPLASNCNEKGVKDFSKGKRIKH